MSRTGADAIRTVDLFATGEARHSVRAFAPREVEAARLGRVLMAANRAPSDAPVVLVFYADPARSAGRYGRRGAELFAGPQAADDGRRGRLVERSDPDAPESERGGRELSERRPDRGVLVAAR
jgi:hypothetical protein